MRSHRIEPGEEKILDVSFLTSVDGPGKHGEFIDFVTNDPATNQEGMRQGDLLFIITVEAATPGPGDDTP